MQNDFFIGVDGGGTKTRLRLESLDGKVLSEGMSGPANIRLSVDVAFASIHEALRQALIKADLKDKKDVRLHVGMGLAGYEVQAARDAFLAKQKTEFFSSLIVQSDAYAACLGAHKGQFGGVIIVGTGVVGLKIVKKGKVQVGGWGFPHGDEGGGAWIGLEAIRKTLHFCDGRGQSSPLLLHIKRKLGGKAESITQWACYANASQFAEIARDVFHFAHKGDSLACELLKNAAKYVEKVFFALEKSEAFSKSKLPFSLVGGVAPFIVDYLKSSLKKRFIPPQGDACDGALFMIRNSYNQN